MVSNQKPNKPSNNERITMLERKVEEQSKEIQELKRQISSLCQIFAATAKNLEVVATSCAINSEEGSGEGDAAATLAPAPEDGRDSRRENMVKYNYKNLLQELCVKKNWHFPVYETSRCQGGFSSSMSLCDEVFSSSTQKSKVLAEKSAACLALQHHSAVDDQGEPLPDSTCSSKKMPKYSWCKNQLQEHFAKHGLPYPTYEIKPSENGKGFHAEAYHEKYPDKPIKGDVAPSKRIAEQMAAYKAIQVWGIDTR